jgi:leucyl-tRNA synthetase
MMFAAPPDQSLEWSDEGVEGANRYLKRLWRAVHAHVSGGIPERVGTESLDDGQRTIRRRLHETIAKVSDDIGRRYTFNTAIAATMEMMNDLSRLEDDSPAGRWVRHESLATLVLLLSPVVPHICQALWDALGGDGLVLDQDWPGVDESALVRDTVEMVVQVKGRVRGRITVRAGADEDTIVAAALAESNVQRFVDDNPVRKVIVVPGKLVNIVV